MYCRKCGQPMIEGATFCSYCGNKTIIQPQPPAQAAPAPPPPSAPSVSTQDYRPPVQTLPQQPVYAQQPAYMAPAQADREPLRVGQYIGMFFLMVIPLVNIILLFVWSFGSQVNQNKKNFARACLILCAISLVLYLLLGVALGGVFAGLTQYFY